MDGLIARSDHEHEFTLHVFTILPGGAAEKIRITEFDKVNIALGRRGGFSNASRLERVERFEQQLSRIQFLDETSIGELLQGRGVVQLLGTGS